MTVSPDWPITVAQMVNQGRIAEARAYMAEYLGDNGGDAEAWRQLARLDLHLKRPDSALDSLGRAHKLTPNAENLAFELGVAYLAADQPDKAVQVLRRHLKLSANHADGHYNLGWALRRLGRTEDAAICFRRALECRPHWPHAAFNLGNCLFDMGQPEQAVTAYVQALAAAPEWPELLANLGLAQWHGGDPDAAEANLRHALRLKAGLASAASALGNLLTAQARVEDALDVFCIARAHNPADPVLAMNHALACRALRRRAEAIAILTQAIEHDRNHAGLHNALGGILLDAHRLDEAEQALRAGLAVEPNNAEIWNNLGNLYASRGDEPQSLSHYRRALELSPGDAAIRSNYLFFRSHSATASRAEVYAEHRRFGEIHEAARPARHRRPGMDQRARRLRIGYVSPDFRDHAVTFWFEPVLDGHDRAQIEVFCYHTGSQCDHVTERLRRKADHWRFIAQLSPDRAAAKIREDEIDILVDLAGHSANNGLLIFARKPAPIQCAWLGYPNTTGLGRIDYRVTSPTADPPGQNDPYYSEKLFRIARAPVFRPPEDAPLPAPVGPVESNGYITFGSFNKPQKISDTVLDVWARILNRLPRSRLFMVAPGGDTEAGRLPFLARLADHGIDPARVDIVGNLPLSEFLAVHDRVDIALDPYPYGGGTTSLFTLWMGVPLVAMSGDGPAGGVSTGTLGSLFLHDLVAQSDEDYVEIALRLAESRDRLRELRATLRDTFRQSVNRWESAFVLELERAYRVWWNALIDGVPAREEY